MDLQRIADAVEIHGGLSPDDLRVEHDRLERDWHAHYDGHDGEGGPCPFGCHDRTDSVSRVPVSGLNLHEVVLAEADRFKTASPLVRSGEDLGTWIVNRYEVTEAKVTAVIDWLIQDGQLAYGSSRRRPFRAPTQAQER